MPYPAFMVMQIKLVVVVVVVVVVVASVELSGLCLVLLYLTNNSFISRR